MSEQTRMMFTHKPPLSVAFETADRWVAILENLYDCFRIQLYGLPSMRAAHKEKKLYLWDGSVCENEAAIEQLDLRIWSPQIYSNTVIENADWEGDQMELKFVRNSQGRELDFVVVRNGKPAFAAIY